MCAKEMEPVSKRLKLMSSMLMMEYENDASTVILPITQLSTYEFTLSSNVLAIHSDKHIRIGGFYEKWIDLYLEYDFYLHFRITKASYKLLCYEIGHLITIPKWHGGHLPIPLKKGVLITLCYLGKGETLLSIGDRFNVADSTVYNVLSKILLAMEMNMDNYIKWPSNSDAKIIASDFFNRGGYPGVIGAIDGCHFRCKIPVEQHGSYQDRKFQHSIGMQGICTTRLLLTNVSIGYPGSVHDARILKESQLYREVIRNGPNHLFYEKYHLIGDSAYPCRNWLMKPYRDDSLTPQQKKLNYILSCSRVVIENTFGQLKGRWRILQNINVYSIQREYPPAVFYIIFVFYKMIYLKKIYQFYQKNILYYEK